MPWCLCRFVSRKAVQWLCLAMVPALPACEGDMAGELHKSLSGKTSESRTIRVIVSPANDRPALCRIVFIAYGGQKNIRAAIGKLQDRSILTVGDSEPFTQAGSMIGLVRSEDRIQIEINMEAVRESDLKLSSRLLNVADLVHSGTARKECHGALQF